MTLASHFSALNFSVIKNYKCSLFHIPHKKKQLIEMHCPKQGTKPSEPLILSEQKGLLRRGSGEPRDGRSASPGWASKAKNPAGAGGSDPYPAELPISGPPAVRRRLRSYGDAQRPTEPGRGTARPTEPYAGPSRLCGLETVALTLLGARANPAGSRFLLLS